MGAVRGAGSGGAHEMGASVSVSSGSVKNLTLYPSPVARP